MADLLYALDWIAGLLFAGALAMTALTSKELLASRRMVWAAFIVTVIRWNMWAYTTEQPWYIRAAIGAAIGAFLFVAIPASLRWIANRESEVSKPDSYRLKLSIDSLNFEDGFPGDPQKSRLLVIGSIENLGAPSIAKNWVLEVQPPNVPKIQGHLLSIYDDSILGVPNGTRPLSSTRSLPNQTQNTKIIGRIDGYVWFDTTPLRTADIKDPHTRLTLSAQDEKGGTHSTSIAIGDIPGPRETSLPALLSEPPELRLDFVPEAVKGDDIAFHLTATNIGKLPVNITRIAYSIPGMMTDAELEKSGKRVLIPTTSIDYRGLPLNGVAKVKVVNVDMEFDCTIYNAVSTFTATYKFALPEGNFIGAVINPTEQHIQSGNIETVSGSDYGKELLQALGNPVATILLSLPEKRPDGAINYTTIQSNNHYFVFDPTSRKAVFVAIYSLHYRKTLVADIIQNKTGNHRVGFAWDDTKKVAELSVDGGTAIPQ